MQVAVIAYLGASSVNHLKAHRLPLAAAVSISLGLLKEAGDYLQVSTFLCIWPANKKLDSP